MWSYCRLLVEVPHPLRLLYVHAGSIRVLASTSTAARMEVSRSSLVFQGARLGAGIFHEIPTPLGTGGRMSF